MRLILTMLVLGCAEDKVPCGEGFGRVPSGDCAPVDLGEAADTGFEGASDNTPPMAPGIELRPGAPRAGGLDLWCRIDVPAVDIDGDALTHRITWTVDGEVYRHAQTAVESEDTVPGSALREGQVWRCTASASDGVETGPAITEAVEVGAAYLGWDAQMVPLADSDYLFLGEAPGDGAGGQVAWAGDVDGDGLGDILVAAYWNDEAGPDAGKCYLVMGKDLGAERLMSLADASWGFTGEKGRVEDDPACTDPAPDDPRCGGDWAGHSLNSAGDVDGDGLPDIVMSGYLSDENGYDAGKTYLIFAASLVGSGTMSLGDADYAFVGERELDRLGHSIASAGDVDGDGLGDLITGAYGFDAGSENTGKTYLVLGSSLGKRRTLQFPGDADFAWEGEAEGDEAGYFNSPAGDLDGDGLGDFLTVSMRNQEGGEGTAPSGEHGAGKIYVLLGADIDLGEIGTTYSLADVDRAWLGEVGGDSVGYGTHAVGDFDGDGVADVMTASYGNSEGGPAAGKAYVMTGASMASPGTWSLSDAAYGFVGEAPGDWAGFGAGPAGDFDRDGLDDIIVGAMWHTSGLLGAGRAYLVLAGTLSGPGTHSLADADHIFTGEAELDTAGYKLVGTGDMNGDGMPDLMISGWQGNVLEESGKVWLLMNPG